MKFINKIKTYKDLQGQLIPVGTCFLYDDTILKCCKAKTSDSCNECYFEKKCDFFYRYMFCISKDCDGKVIDVIYIKES